MVPFTPAVLQSSLTTGDPLADAVIDHLYTNRLQGANLWAIVQAQAALGEPACAALCAEVHTVPDWLDWRLVDHGAAVFLGNAPLALFAFALGALPLTYAPPGIAKVLAATGRLERDVLRRLYETGSMVAAVLQPDALRPGGDGVATVLRVRLMHALVRRHVRRHSDGPHAPINQTELAWVACGFSHVVLRGLEQLGVHLTEADRIAYHHLWRYANRLMGVSDPLLARSPAEDALLYRQLKTALCAPDDASRLLTDALHEALAVQPPFYLPRRTLETLSTALIDDKGLSTGLGIIDRPERRLLPLAIAPVGLASRFSRRLGPYPARWGRAYVRYVLNEGLQGRLADFQLQGAH